MILARFDDNTRLFYLTVGQFKELAKGLDPPTTTVEYNNEEFVFGLDGLAKMLHCSRTTAWTLKTSGKIDKAFSQTGRKLIFNKQKVLEILKQK